MKKDDMSVEWLGKCELIKKRNVGRIEGWARDS